MPPHLSKRLNPVLTSPTNPNLTVVVAPQLESCSRSSIPVLNPLDHLILPLSDESYNTEDFCFTLDPEDLPQELNWSLPQALLLMSPSLLNINLSKTLVINSRSFRQIVIYDADEHRLTSYL